MTRGQHISEFQEKLISWYNKCGRVFYWRIHTLNGWQWLVLELLLKRTRAETVEKRFPSLIAKYSCPEIVVQTSDWKLEKDLKFLGLYRQRRAALKLIAESIVKNHNSQIPSDQASLASLPHVGLYISNAVACFCFDQRKPVVDSNIARVLTRFNGLKMPSDAREKWIWDLAEKLLPETNWKEYNYGLLDTGAIICRKRVPECPLCCLKDICKCAEGSSRQDRC